MQKTKTNCYLEICHWLVENQDLYMALKQNALWNRNRESTKVAVIEAVNYWYKGKYQEEFRQNPSNFFQLNISTWLRLRIKKQLIIN